MLLPSFTFALQHSQYRNFVLACHFIPILPKLKFSRTILSRKEMSLNTSLHVLKKAASPEEGSIIHHVHCCIEFSCVTWSFSKSSGKREAPLKAILPRTPSRYNSTHITSLFCSYFLVIALGLKNLPTFLSLALVA